jgi:hypothetical protein
MKDNQDINYTRKLFDDAIALKEPDRVPVMANAFSWPIVVSKYRLSEALRDYDKLFEVYYGFAKDYCHDSLSDIGWRNPVRCRDVLGINADYEINDEEGYINHIEEQCLEVDEYDEFVADSRKFIMEKFMPRRMTNLKGSRLEAKNTFKNALGEFAALGQYMDRLGEAIAELGVLKAGIGVIPYFEMWVSNFRGLKGTLYDMRRIPAKVEAAFEKLGEIYDFAAYDVPFKLSPPPKIPPSVDIVFPVIAGYMLNQAQFGRFVWPQLKRLADRAQSDGKTILVFTEGNCEHLYEYFLQLPRGLAGIYTVPQN